jgi:hypothetical protein
MACVSFTTTTPTRPSGVFHPVLGRKIKKPPDPYQFGGNIKTRRTHFSHWWTDSWQVFGRHWGNIDYCPLQFQNHSIWPPSQRSRWTTYPLLGIR